MNAGARGWRRMAWAWMLLGVAWLMVTVAARLVPGAMAIWSEKVYPAWAWLVVPWTERASWPWTPWLLGVLILLAAVTSRRVASRRHAFLPWLALAATLAGSFDTSWGLHAARPPVEQRLGLTGSAADEAALEAMAARLLAILLASEPAGEIDEVAAHASLRTSLRTFAPDVRLPRRVKAVSGMGFGILGVAGIVSPWTLEAHVDAGLPAWSRVAVTAHELAHLAGFESEAGAELVGLLAGLRADHPDARYAAALRAWVWLPVSVRAEFTLPERATSDLTALARSASRRDDRLARWAWSLYERYLTTRGQAEGTAGYGRGATLLLDAQRAGLW